MATSLLDPVAQHAADVVQQRGLGRPDRNALLAGVLAQRTPRSGLFSKDSKVCLSDVYSRWQKANLLRVRFR
jgi:hypothetical protein